MNNSRRLISFVKGSILRRALAPVIGGLGVGAYVFVKKHPSLLSNAALNNPLAHFSVMSAAAETKWKCQDMVVHEDKGHGLFLIIHLNSSAAPKECIQSLQKLQAHVDRISPKDIRDEDNEIIMGIGFGPAFLGKVYPDSASKGVEPYVYKPRKSKSAEMPATGGDILIHAVCSEKGKLFELTQALLADLPKGAVKNAEEIYGWVYRGGRDLSGFIDGTENPADEDERLEVGVSKKTGGSYIITQRWIHDLSKIRTESDKKMENYIGRTKEDSIEIAPIAVHSHVGRMTHGLSDAEADEKRIVRHSMPYGSVTGEAGLFFIAYSSTPRTLDWMLDRMAGHSPDATEDSLFQFTKPVTGTYFYSPSKAELDAIFKQHGAKKGFW